MKRALMSSEEQLSFVRVESLQRCGSSPGISAVTCLCTMIEESCLSLAFNDTSLVSRSNTGWEKRFIRLKRATMIVHPQ